MDNKTKNGLTLGVAAAMGELAGMPMPSAAVAALKQMRANQFIKDRTAVLASMDVDEWIVFCLRWGIAPPPQGFEDREQLLGLMHMSRMQLVQTDDISRLASAHWLQSRGIRLPGTYKLRDGLLTGGPRAD